MKTLQEIIKGMYNDAGVGQSIHKHLSAVGINEWEDITRGSLYDLRDYLATVLAPSSQKTVMAHIKCIFNRYKDEHKLPDDYDKILNNKVTKPLKTYLTEEDLAKLEKFEPKTKKTEWIKNVFLICAYTGLRVSDALKLTAENIVGENLHYVAQKTKKSGAIPLKPGIAERIIWMNEHPQYSVSITFYNRAIKLLCKRAGIDDDVLVFKAGKEMRGPKWKFISSHSARISTATCLDRRGVQIGDICQLLQHSSVTTTERYIVRDRIQLSDEAMKFFK